MTRVFRRVPGSETDRGKRDDSNQRAAEQRPLGLVDDRLGYLELFHAALYADEDALGNDDGVVDHHAQRDDQRAERYSVHRDAAHTHGGQRCKDR